MSDKTSKPLFTKRRYRDLPIGGRLYLANLLIITIPMILLAILANRFSSDILVEKSISNTVKGLQIVGRSIDSVLSQVEYLSEMAVSNYGFFDKIYNLQEAMLMASGNSEYIAMEYARSVNRSLSSIVGRGDIIKSIIIYSEYGKIYTSNPIESTKMEQQRKNKEDFLTQVKALKGWVTWQNTRKLDYLSDNLSYDCIAMYRALVDGTSGGIYGTIEIDVDQSVITQTFSPLGDKIADRTYIIDDTGTILAAARDEMLYQNVGSMSYFPWVVENNSTGKIFTIDGQPFLVTSVKYEKLGWHIVGLTPLEDLTGDNRQVTVLIFSFALVCMLIATLFSIINARTIIRPIKQLSQDMEHASHGDLTVRSTDSGRDETGRLAASFNTLIERISDLMDRIYSEQRKKRKYELQALQSQINPHFLYNALESVCSLAQMGRQDQVVEMVEAIAKFYRTTLSSGKDIVTICEEFANVRHYLFIQKIRYRDKFDYTIDYDERFGSLPIVKLTLQPLVENAIYHGLKPKAGKGSIRVSIVGAEDEIRVSVYDDGIGMSESVFQRSLMETDDEGDRKSFGLKSVNDRIKLYFGETYGLRLANDDVDGSGCGTRIEVTLPAGQAINTDKQRIVP